MIHISVCLSVREHKSRNTSWVGLIMPRNTIARRHQLDTYLCLFLRQQVGLGFMVIPNRLGGAAVLFIGGL